MADDNTDRIPYFLLKDTQDAAVKLHARLRKSDKIAKALLAYYEQGNPITFTQKHESMVRALMASGISDV